MQSLLPPESFFYKEALKISGQYHRSLESLSHFKDSKEHGLRIGTLPFLSQYHLTSQIHRFCTEHPEIPFSLKEVEDQELLSGLEDEQFDLILARKNMLDLKLCHFCLLTEDRISAVFPTSHSLAEKESVSLKELSGETFILMPPHTSIYKLCMQSFHKENLHPQIVRTARAESIVSAVEAGEGISLLTESSFRLFRQPLLTAVPVKGLEKLSIGIAYKKRDLFRSLQKLFLILCLERSNSAAPRSDQNPSSIPTVCTRNATTQAVAHCKNAMPTAARTVPISLRTVAIAATHGVYRSVKIRNTYAVNGVNNVVRSAVFPPRRTVSVDTTLSFAIKPVISAVETLQSPNPKGAKIGATTLPIIARRL